MDHGAHNLAPGTHTPSSLPPCLFFALASMAGCALFYEAEDSDLSETPCCRSHTGIYLWPSKSWVTKLSLLHRGLNRQESMHPKKKEEENILVKLKTTSNVYKK